jgi:hypothetical protein
MFHHRGTRLRKGYGAAGAVTEVFSFFAYREIRRRPFDRLKAMAGQATMGKKNNALRGIYKDK